MAPEVIAKGVNYTYTADWFSFGCVCYKLVVGYVIVTMCSDDITIAIVTVHFDLMALNQEKRLIS